jgi:hypothetical protein
VAATIRRGARAVIARNVKNFPDSAFEPLALSAIWSDAIVLELIDSPRGPAMPLIEERTTL